MAQRTNKREKKERKAFESISSFYPKDFPVHLTELCSEKVRSQICCEGCSVSPHELKEDSFFLFGRRMSQKFMEGFSRQFVENEINRRDQYGRTPLICLLERERSLSPSTTTLEYPIHQLASWYSKNNPFFLLIYFLSTWKANPNIVDNQGNSPLHYAIMSGPLIIVERLLKLGKPDPNIQNRRGVAPIHLAFASWEKLFLLLESGADPNVTNLQKETPLHIFFKNQLKRGYPDKNSFDVTDLLLVQHPKCNLNAQDKDGKTPLHVFFDSLFSRQRLFFGYSIMGAILNYGGDPTITDNEGRTAYQLALRRFGTDGYSTLFYFDRWMRKHAPETLFEARQIVGWPHNLVDIEGNSILHLLMEEFPLAHRKLVPRYTYDPAHTELEFFSLPSSKTSPLQENLELIEEVLEAKLDVNAKNLQNMTPLHLAAMRSFYEAVRILVFQNEANVNSQDQHLQTPIFSAIRGLVKETRRRGPWLRGVMEKKKNQLKIEREENEELWEKKMLLVENGFRIIEFLQSSGAKMNAMTTDQRTLLHLACTLPDPFCSRIVNLLLKSGTNLNSPDSYGQTPIMIACSTPDCPENALELLIQAGADVNTDGIDCLFNLAQHPSNLVSSYQKILAANVVVESSKERNILHKVIDGLSRTRESSRWANQAAIIELLIEAGACARTRLKAVNQTALQYFVDIASKNRQKYRDWNILGPIFLRIGLALSTDGVTLQEKKFVHEKIGDDALSPSLQSLWEHLEIFKDIIKPAKREG